MSVNVSPPLSDVYASLREFLIAFVVPTGTEVIRGQDNRVSQPVAGHVVMQNVTMQKLSTNVHLYADPMVTIQAFTLLRMQMDFYGANAAEWAQAASTLLRDAIGCMALAPACQPLHADDATQSPLITGEQQYLNRYTLEAYIQWNPVVTLPQQFADTLSALLVNVDERYPPS